MNKLLIGWSEVDITPDQLGKPIALDGQYYARTARKIHSRLKCIAAAFSSGEEYFLTASLDIAACPKEFYDAVCDETVKLAPEIDRKHILLNAIHTHCAPSPAFIAAGTDIPWETVEPGTLTPREYADFAIPAVAGNLVRAWRSRRPGGIIRGFGSARLGHCRRARYANGTAEMYGDTSRADFIGMETGEDTGVELLFTADETGKRTGVIVNAACPAQIMEAAYAVSSDFAGAARELLKQEYGEDFHMIYQISAAGCQSPRDLVRRRGGEPDFWHEDGVAAAAARLAGAVKNAMLQPPETAPVLKYLAVPLSLPRRRVSYTAFREAEAELCRLLAIRTEAESYADFCAELHAKEAAGGPGPYDSKLHHFVQIQNVLGIIARYRDQDQMPNLDFTMSVIRLGDAVFANNPFELYLAYGQNIKARSRAAQTFLVQLSNGTALEAGYLPTPEAEEAGGYGAQIINGQAGAEAGFLLADATVNAIATLFEQP